MLQLGLIAVLCVVLLATLHEEFQYWLATVFRWWRRRYRPTRWNTHDQWRVAKLIARVK